ncbi:A/G-specific DNA-adenine glycosylase [Muriicola jejuensis]|uniref:Adenine DNA glycosylase n=1 Tax=Muriicola jejuensis TaxID=504488 RepID=A0A6P0UJ56_9FLAO|nr:A/G-specific adenine glycosylase [Muriicola jejuensis]NER10236.1 A/G-specific adenine glycosylase [Muriicola jejuensis]SMP01873.1 A/G-specific DNA-adenine glycosylase [Muriicola jejuensis]
MTRFSKTVLTWYSDNKRELPWRGSRDPYKIWLSEVILQQTRVAQGMPYYLKFIERFPTVSDLARATETEILKLWQGLGYYSRARNMHAAARTVEREYDGSFPTSYKALVKLKGVGDYTASAIASICSEEPTPVVDGNVYRVLARYFGVEIPTNTSAGIKYFKQLAREVMDPSSIGDYNQAIMEFGALQCKPQNPGCETCPLNESCKARQDGRVAELPVKLRQKKVKTRFFNYLVYLDSHKKTRLQKRTGKGIWRHMYEFPLLETDRLLEPDEIYSTLNNEDQGGEVTLWKEEPVVHKLSHQHLITRFWIIELEEEITHGIPLEKIDDYPVPVLVSEFLRTFKNSYF